MDEMEYKTVLVVECDATIGEATDSDGEPFVFIELGGGTHIVLPIGARLMLNRAGHIAVRVPMAPTE